MTVVNEACRCGATLHLEGGGPSILTERRKWSSEHMDCRVRDGLLEAHVENHTQRLHELDVLLGTLDGPKCPNKSCDQGHDYRTNDGLDACKTCKGLGYIPVYPWDKIDTLLRERIANLNDRLNQADDDDRPHSRACGISPHPHGDLCSHDCPTCNPIPKPPPGRPDTSTGKPRPHTFDPNPRDADRCRVCGSKYHCTRCNQPCNMTGTGHGLGECEEQ